jgi:hypothetical protein
MTDENTSTPDDWAKVQVILTQVLALTPHQRILLQQALAQYHELPVTERATFSRRLRQELNDSPLILHLVLGPTPTNICEFCGRSK